MFACRYAVAVASIICTTFVAAELTTLDFNITIPLNSSNILYSQHGWTEEGDNLVYNLDEAFRHLSPPSIVSSSSKGSNSSDVPELSPVRLPKPVIVQAGPSTGICFYGNFWNRVDIVIEKDGGQHSSQNRVVLSGNNQSTVCLSTTYGVYRYSIRNGVVSLSSIVLKSRMSAPVGSTVSDIAIYNQPFVADGSIVISEAANLAFKEAPTVEAITADGLNFTTSMSMNVTLPLNTTFFILRGPSSPTWANVYADVAPGWPDIYHENPSPEVGNWELVSHGEYAPVNSSLWQLGSLDPGTQYTVRLNLLTKAPPNADGSMMSGGSFDKRASEPLWLDWRILSSIDIYSIREKPPLEPPKTPSKSILGPAVGGVIGGLALLALLVFGFWYLRRQRERKRYGEDDVKFQIDTENQITTPFAGHPAGYMNPEAAETDVGGKFLTHSGNIDNATAVRNLIRESDGGGLIQGEDEYLPPLYNPSWSAPSGSSEESGSGLAPRVTDMSSTTETSSLTVTYPRDKKELPPIVQ